jgi:hypothetical protein
MKKTRKQKLRQRLDRKEESHQRKCAIVGRVLKMLDIEDTSAPIPESLRDEFVKRVGPAIEVIASEKSAGDAIVEAVRREIETIVDRPIPLELDGRRITLALGDFYRGYVAVSDLLEMLLDYLQRTKITRPSAAVPGFREACVRAQYFADRHLPQCLGRLVYQLHRVVEAHLRYDQHIVWYRIERNPRYPGRDAYRIVVGRRPQAPHYLHVDGRRRKCYPCEVPDLRNGLTPLTWKPSELGVGDSGEEIPVYISDHAIARLYERIPLAPHFDVHHRILRTALELARIHPSSREGEFLVEAGDPGRKVGYFVVAATPDYIYVKTFLLLTMQGTPEAQRLRIKAGLSRRDIIAFKLDNLFTLAGSDIGEDAELRAMLVDCGCGHLLELFRAEDRLSWLDTHRDSLRRAVGLTMVGPGGGDAGGERGGTVSAEAMAAYAEKLVKASQGWTT